MCATIFALKLHLLHDNEKWNHFPFAKVMLKSNNIYRVRSLLHDSFMCYVIMFFKKYLRLLKNWGKIINVRIKVYYGFKNAAKMKYS